MRELINEDAHDEPKLKLRALELSVRHQAIAHARQTLFERPN
jgi:hypothetical protein